jgi:hypothetical protein
MPSGMTLGNPAGDPGSGGYMSSADRRQRLGDGRRGGFLLGIRKRRFGVQQPVN